MNISENGKKELISEISFVLKNMKNTKNTSEKMFFFSAVYAMAQRIMNFEYDSELLFLYQVLQLAYQTINARVTTIQSGAEVAVNIPENLFTNLENYLQELSEVIEDNKSTCPVLQKIINLSYVTTGNGYYLYLKGMLKL